MCVSVSVSVFVMYTYKRLRLKSSMERMHVYTYVIESCATVSASVALCDASSLIFCVNSNLISCRSCRVRSQIIQNAHIEECTFIHICTYTHINIPTHTNTHNSKLWYFQDNLVSKNLYLVFCLLFLIKFFLLLFSLKK